MDIPLGPACHRACGYIEIVRRLEIHSELSLSPTYIKAFDVFANGDTTGDCLAALDDFTQLARPRGASEIGAPRSKESLR
jgi:hypothetical protein